MADILTQPVPSADRALVRDLAKRVAEIAAMPIQAQRIKEWKRHNSLDRPRPMILFFPEGSWGELMPWSNIKVTDDRLKGIEYTLRMTIYQHEHFDVDNVVTADFGVGKAVNSTGWGIKPEWTFSKDPRGARTFKPVIHESADLKKITAPVLSYDEKATLDSLAFHQDLFGDILNVRLCGSKHFSFHLMSQYTSLRGLEEVMMDMVLNPGMLHEAMSILEQAHHGVVRQMVEQNLLDLNNDNSYHSSGGNGWTDELPAKGFTSGRVRPIDVWASAEAQELAQVSPEMHTEFSLQYEKRLLAPFGLNGYGCCEDLTRKMDDVLTIPNIRRISISPWADVDVCAQKIGRKAIFSWKPHPAHLCGHFDEQAIRKYIAHTVEATKDCCVEMILKDTHTCDNHPERFDRWSQIAREVIEQYGV
ncbi:MAG: hypothetical protein ABFD92_00715 [Planctomycetaceae bacterium]|nr:hypothetical protein [Planctomycetaceae bacterium]